jgi:hypothetical protein
MALKRKSKRAPARKRRRPATRATRKPSARKPTRARKPKLSDDALTGMFTKAVRAGSRPMAAKLAREMRRRSKYGPYDARFGRVSADDLRTFEGLTKPRKRH